MEVALSFVDTKRNSLALTDGKDTGLCIYLYTLAGCSGCSNLYRVCSVAGALAVSLALVSRVCGLTIFRETHRLILPRLAPLGISAVEPVPPGDRIRQVSFMKNLWLKLLFVSTELQ